MILPLSIIMFVLSLGTITGNIAAKKKALFWILYCAFGIALICIITFRSPNMPDYDQYVGVYRYSNLSKLRFEPADIAIYSFCKSITQDYLFLFFVFGLLTVTIKLYVIEKISPFIWGSLCVYVGGFFILHDMIQIRAAVAIGILLFSIPSLYQRNWIKFGIIVLIATMFHYSSLCFLFMAFLRADMKHTKIFMLLIPLSYLLYFKFPGFAYIVKYIPIAEVADNTKIYENSNGHVVNVFNLHQLFRCVYAYILMFNMKEIYSKYKYGPLLLKIFIIGLCSFVLLIDMPGIAFRVSELLMTVDMLLIPSLVLVNTDSFWKNLVMRGMVVIYGFSTFYITTFYNGFLL